MPDIHDSKSVLSNLRQTGAYSDLTIVCGPIELPVHRNIVCTQSEYFATTCTEPWTAFETGVKVFHLHAVEDDEDGLIFGDNPHAIRLMVDYLYHHDYDVRHKPTWRAYLKQSHDPALESTVIPDAQLSASISPPPMEPLVLRSRKEQWREQERLKAAAAEAEMQALREGREGALCMHAELYTLGHKYRIPALQDLAVRKIKSEAGVFWRTESFIDAINIAFRTTHENDKTLRQAIKDLILEKHAILVDNESFIKTVESIDGLLYDLFKESCSRQL